MQFDMKFESRLSKEISDMIVIKYLRVKKSCFSSRKYKFTWKIKIKQYLKSVRSGASFLSEKIKES